MLEHPGIVHYEGEYEDEDNIYILMEYCALGNLWDYFCSRGSRLAESEVQNFILQLLDAVEYMHSKNVIHRDLKLANIFIQDGNRLKIGDFGMGVQLADKQELRK